MRPTLIAAGLALVASLAVACSSNHSELGAPVTVEVPAGAGSLAPNLALGNDGELYLSWIEPTAGGHALRLSTWQDGAWSEPRRVAEGDDWFVNWADIPSVAALADGTLAAHWLQKSGEATYAYDVVASISRDAGRSWSSALRPHRDQTPTEHGFATLVPAEPEAFDLIWLDGRETLHEGAMALRHARLDVEGHLSASQLIDPRVCDCCSTDAVRSAAGGLLVVYRDRSEGEIRDISIARGGLDGWSAPRTVHDDGWEIAGCPVNGPELASADGSVAVAWFTSPGSESSVQVAFANDEGFAEPIRVDDGEPIGRVDLVLADAGLALVSWVEQVGEGAEIRLRELRSDGPGRALTVARTSGSRASGVPRMVRHGDRLVLVWTEAGESTRIRSATLALGQ